MIFRAWFLDTGKWKNLLRYKVNYETNRDYKHGVNYLLSLWWNIIAIVCDWRIWLLNWFWSIPTQMCIVHQKWIIRRYLTKRPRIEANRELKEIADNIWIWREETLFLWLEDWYKRNNKWLYEKNEKNENNNYRHERTIKAYKSIKKNLPYLHTFKRYPDLWIPETNNSLESINSHLKTKLRIHRWLKEYRKDKFISYYLRLS